MFNRVVLVLLFLTAVIYDKAFGSYPQRVLLRDVNVITLHNGQYTNARRSSPIPQLKCVGGTAGCSTFTPQVVQCYNRGSDGYDVQWECKTDMDNAYRFGKLEVSCEGFDFPDDPYILQGSCGLEYKLDLTGSGQHQNQQKYQYTGQKQGDYSKSSSGLSVGGIVIVCFIIYGIYKWLNSNQQRQNVNQHDDDSSYPRRPPPPGFNAPPPPPGFRPEYMPGSGSNSGGCSSSYTDDNFYSSTHQRHTGAGAGTAAGGGFWTGAATGGVLGYLFGSRNTAGYQHQPTYANPGWGNSGFGNFGSSSSGSSSSGAGARTASGFGGTTRR